MLSLLNKSRYIVYEDNCRKVSFIKTMDDLIVLFSKLTIKEVQRKCSVCKQQGHDKRKCTTKSFVVPTQNNNISVYPQVKKTLRTEDTGKIFEMAICLAYGIQYDGKYKYGMEESEKLKPRLQKLTELFPMCVHTAKKSARYDFTSIADKTKHLSAKTTKKGIGKVAPQVVGQSQPIAFCNNIGITFTTIPDLKKHIQEKIVDIMPILVNYTFDCPNIYYNQEKDSIRFITMKSQINWNMFQYRWTCNLENWNNSSTLKIIHNEKEVSIVEFQFHTASRTNMAVRWCYENFLELFKRNLTIIDF